MRGVDRLKPATTEQNRIASRLRGERVLLMGSTGFLAKVLMEKLLRAIPDIGQLYLLVRPRSDGTTAESRMKREVLGGNAFDRLRAAWGPHFDRMCREKISVVSGDLTEERFGLSKKAYAALAKDVTLIVNSAATVTFDEQLDAALSLNVGGVAKLLQFAKDCGNVPMLQVSTAYVSGVQTGVIPETVIPNGHTVASVMRGESHASFDLDETMATLEAEIAEIKKRHASSGSSCRRELISLGMAHAQRHGWHDTYTFTKWLSEQFLVRDHGEVPLVIFRPAIIEGSYEEPAPGWIDGLRMADPLILAYGRGKLREFPGESDIALDLIPVDFVANAIIATMPAGRSGSSVEVYQCGSSGRNAVGLTEMALAVREAFRRRPMRDDTGRPIRVAPLVLMPRERFLKRWGARLKRVQRMRSILRSTKLAPRLRKSLAGAEAQISQLIYFVKIYSPYTHLRAQFSDDRLCEVFEGLHPEDRALFPFDVSRIDWHEYLVYRHVPGVRHFVLGSGAALEAPMLAAGYAVEDESPDAPPPMQVLSALRGESIHDVFENAARAYPKRIALQVRRNDRWMRYTFAEAQATIAAIARRFAENGLKPSDRIAIYSENSPEWGLTYLAAMRQGLTVVPLDVQLPTAEALSMSRFAGVSVICAGRSNIERVREAIAETSVTDGEAARLVAVELNESFVPPPGTARDAGPPPATVSGDDLASIVFTSGTTVAPKGVMLQHRSFLANARSLVHAQPVQADDQFLSVLPMHHVFEFTGGFLVPMANASTVTYVENMTGAEIVSLMNATGTTVMMVVPRLLKLFHDGIMRKVETSGWFARRMFAFMGWLSDKSGGRAGRKLFARVHNGFGGRLRIFVCGGSALPASLFQSYRRLGFTVCEGYGLTETAPVLTVNPPDGARAGSVGLPLPEVELDIRHQNSDGVGEMWARGPNLMVGYYNNEDATNEVIKDGWFRTGDLCCQDADGFVYVTGRVKDVIITAAGKNVYPDEVALQYTNLPHTKEMCVLAMPNPDGIGDSVDAVVVLDIESVADVDRSAIEAEVRTAVAQISEKLPTYQRIQNLHFWTTELPKTSTLKVKRAEVAQRLIERENPERLAATATGGGRRRNNVGGIGPIDSANEAWLRETLARLSHRPPTHIRADANLLLDLGIDSLTKMQLLGEIEHYFGMALPDQVGDRLGRVSDLHSLIGDRTPLNGRAPDGRAWLRRLPRFAANDGVNTGAAGTNGHAAESSGAMRWVVRSGIGLFFHSWVRTEAAGLDNIPRKGAFILAANHSSHLDSAAVLTAIEPTIRDTDRRVYVAGAADYFFNNRVKAWVFGSLCDTIAVDRSTDGMDGLRRCAETLSGGHGLLLFPEGTRSLTGEMQPFKLGVAVLAMESKVPIVPVHIDNAFDLLPKGRMLVRPGSVRVVFGAPVQMDAVAGQGDFQSRYAAYRDLTQRVQQAVEMLGKTNHTRAAK